MDEMQRIGSQRHASQVNACGGEMSKIWPTDKERVVVQTRLGHVPFDDYVSEARRVDSNQSICNPSDKSSIVIKWQ